MTVVEGDQKAPFSIATGGCLRGVMVKAMDCRIVVSEFELQLLYYVYFRANTLGKGNIYPTPPLGQDMTQGQLLSGV